MATNRIPESASQDEGNISQDEVMFNITDNYRIPVPAKFIDAITQDIIKIPVMASDTVSYEANSLVEWFANKQQGSPTFGKIVNSDKKVINNLDKQILIFNFDLYNQIRNFFATVLERDKDLLNDGEHAEELSIVEDYAQQQLIQNDVIILVEGHQLTIQGLYVLPKSKPEPKKEEPKKEEVVLSEDRTVAPNELNTLNIQTETSVHAPSVHIALSEERLISPSASRSSRYVRNEPEEPPSPSETCIALKRGIFGGAAASDIFFYGINLFAELDNNLLLNSPITHLAAIPPSFFMGCALNCCSSRNSGCGWVVGATSGALSAMANSGINYGLSVLTGLPAWSTPLITFPVIAILTCALPAVVDKCRRSNNSQNRFCFWNREQETQPVRESVSHEAQSQQLLSPRH